MFSMDSSPDGRENYPVNLGNIPSGVSNYLDPNTGRLKVCLWLVATLISTEQVSGFSEENFREAVLTSFLL